jgi:hypothetical protein
VRAGCHTGVSASPLYGFGHISLQSHRTPDAPDTSGAPHSPGRGALGEWSGRALGPSWPSSTVAAIPPNRLYLIAQKDVLALLSSTYRRLHLRANFPYRLEPELSGDFLAYYSPLSGDFRHELPGLNVKKET